MAPDWNQQLAEVSGPLKARHDLKLSLCDSLEHVADSLPSNVSTSACLTLARCVVPTVRRAQILEEDQFFPLLLEVYAGAFDVAALVERLRREHCEDEGFAEDVAMLLTNLAGRDETVDAETAGYMLRGFVTGIRRHVAFERDCLTFMSCRS